MLPLSSGAPVYLTEEIRAIEKRAAAASPAASLMESAGRAAAEHARRMLGDRGNAVLVLAGPGNNGGDALVAARWLKVWWFNVSVVFFGDAEKMTDDAAHALHAFRTGGNEVLAEIPADCWDLVIDGLFGIGLRRELGGVYADVIARVNGMKTPVLALDVPSGLDADTGNILGAAICADETITFIGLKPGLVTGDGPDCCGKLRVETLDLDESLFPAPRGRLIAPSSFAKTLAARPINSHKGLFGSVGVIGGAQGMIGAALLAGRAALKLGAGKVHVGLLANELSVDVAHPEFMLADAHEVIALDALSCLVVGPGLGRMGQARELVAIALARRLPLVLDADALNLIGADEPLQKALIARHSVEFGTRASTVLTPHPGEAARLLGSSTTDVQSDRVRAAVAMANRFHSHVVLKGAGSICALPSGAWYVNPTGNPGMASGGMGDVLSGLLGALLGRAGVSADDALLCAVFVHGAAADDLVSRVPAIGPVGLTASEVADAARAVFNRLAQSPRFSPCPGSKYPDPSIERSM